MRVISDVIMTIKEVFILLLKDRQGEKCLRTKTLLLLVPISVLSSESKPESVKVVMCVQASLLHA